MVSFFTYMAEPVFSLPVDAELRLAHKVSMPCIVFYD